MRRRFSGGFTLVEMLVVLSVVLILMSLVVPSWTAYLRSTQIDREAASLVSAIQLAQVKAIKEMRPWRVRLAPDGGGFQIEYFKRASGGELQSCDEGIDWEPFGTPHRFVDGLLVKIDTVSRLCFPFGAVGRPAWPTPSLVDSASSSTTSLPQLLNVLDGRKLKTQAEAPNPAAEGAPVAYWNEKPTTTLLFDVGEQRFIAAPCIGLYANPPPDFMTNTPSWRYHWVYPTNISIKIASTADLPEPADLTSVPLLPEQQPKPTQPINHGGRPSVECLPLPINRSVRWIELKFTLDVRFRNPHLVLHEFDITPLQIEMMDAKTNRIERRLQIDSATGLVTG